LFSKHQHKAEFRNLEDSAVIISEIPGLRTFAASMTSTASTTSVASMTSTASMHQKKYSSLAPKWSNPIPFCGMDIKNQIFYWYLILFLSEAVEADFLKTGWWNSNIQTLTNDEQMRILCLSHFISTVHVFIDIFLVDTLDILFNQTG
jgi:hypothetical protein